MAFATDTELTPQDKTAPPVESETINEHLEPETDDELVEEVSIDGMCGVY